MIDCSDIFSSRSKYKILRILSLRSTAIHLRALSEITGLQVRSVQVALKGLEAKEVVTSTWEGNKKMYSINQMSLYESQLIRHFTEERDRRIETRSKELALPKSFLENIHQARMLTWSKRSGGSNL